jgi:hypothetical protein
MIETSALNTWPFLPGPLTSGTLPAAATCPQMMAYCSDVKSFMLSDGLIWKSITDKRFETYAGVTDASGNYTVVFATPFPGVPRVFPVLGPGAAANARIKPTVELATGFTVNANTNAGVNILGIDVLLLATTNVAGAPVRVLVVES